MHQRRRAALAVLMLLTALLSGLSFFTAPAAQATHGTQCHDGLDNDLDGQIDYPNDFGCTGYTDTTESDGSWNTGNSGQVSGRFYAKVKKATTENDDGETVTCQGARSRAIRP